MLKKLLFAAVITVLLLSFCGVFADQDGRKCWCSIDEYGCLINGDEGGKIYIMFWTEEARQHIMGPNSAPYKNVVRHPGISGTLPLECKIGSANGNSSLADCKAKCETLPDDCLDQESDCIGAREECIARCEAQ